MDNHPKLFNSNHFSTEKFPEVIAFCDRNGSSHLVTASEESYDYTLLGQTRYTLKKFAAQWELIEQADGKTIRVSTGRSLGMVLLQGLRFSDSDKGKQEKLVNILIPCAKADVEKALALMYYFGGYPNNFLDYTAEVAIILDRFVDPDLAFLSYSYVPAVYLEWLRDELKTAGIISEGANRTLWVYKK
jgi:hypothetical protein